MLDYTNMLNKGFSHHQDLELASIFDDFPLNSVTWTDDGWTQEKNVFLHEHALANPLLMTAQHTIASKYLKPHFKDIDFIHRKIWTSFTEDQLNFHNDMHKQNEDADSEQSKAKYNLIALLYLSDMSKRDNEGRLWLTNQKTTDIITPEVGTLVIINCYNPDFQHKGEWTDSPRYLAQFGYHVPEELLTS